MIFFSQYLESVRPLLDNEQYNKMELLASDFKENKAAQLQRCLILKSWWATNYVSSVFCHATEIVLNCNDRQ